MSYIHTYQAIIINCGTRKSTTLAILSALRYVGMPLLVLNCTLPKDCEQQDMTYLKRLQTYCAEQQIGKFELIDRPLMHHGDTLDWLFTHLSADNILLIDSDLEILNGDYLEHMKRWMIDKQCFGAGFFHGPYFGFQGDIFPEGYYQERMWIPFCILRRKVIAEAIEKQGLSFNIVKLYNDVPCNQRLSGLLYKYSRKLGISLRWNPLRKRYLGFRPNYILKDTGAEIYRYLREKGYYFAGARHNIHPLYVNHYDGVTRSVLMGDDETSTNYYSVEDIITERLKTKYNFDEQCLYI